MDRITAGSAVAVNEATAHALGAAPQTAVSATTQAYSGSPIAGAPFLNYATSQATASASRGELVQAGLSSQISVDGANGGARIDAAATGTAAGNGTSRAQVSTQTYGISTSRTDLVFGSVSAVACCGPAATAQVKVDSAAGGPYSRELSGTSVSDIPGQVQRTVDIAVVSSALPILDPAQVLVTGAPARISPKYGLAAWCWRLCGSGSPGGAPPRTPLRRAFPRQQKSIDDALAQWEFKPYRVNGNSVEIETGLVFEFKPATR